MARLRSDLWVQAYLRQRIVQGCPGVLMRRGAAEAGAIFVRIDHLDGRVSLYGPAAQGMGADDGIRRFHLVATDNSLAISDRLERELKFDSDLWIVEIEDRGAEPGLDLAQD